MSEMNESGESACQSVTAAGQVTRTTSARRGAMKERKFYLLVRNTRQTRSKLSGGTPTTQANRRYRPTLAQNYETFGFEPGMRRFPLLFG